MVDPIATTAVALLAPYLATIGNEVAQKAGDALWGLTQSLYETIRQKFSSHQNTYAQQTLLRLKEAPTNEARQAALADVLTETLKEDPTFAETIRKFVQDATQTPGLNQFLTQVYGNAQVEKIINIGHIGTAQF